MNQNHSSTDIIPLINKAWNDSFARVSKNKNTIAERGWYPLNRNILLNEELRSTMTPTEVCNEMISDSITIPSPYFRLLSPSDSTIISSSSSTKQPSLNFSSGTASLCLEAIITSHDLQKGRERKRKEKEDGKSVAEKLKASATITAGIV